MLTIRDVAKRSGFSPTTVSMVLNNAPLSRYIPNETKEAIRKAAKDLDYTPNVFARSLRAQKTDTVGVVVFDIADPYCTHVIQGIEQELSRAGFLYLLCDARNDKTKFRKNLDLLLQRRIEGLIIVANALSMEASSLTAAKVPKVPVLVIGRTMNQGLPSSSVTVDNERGGYLALQHLHELGHRRIAFLRGPASIADSSLRWGGVEKYAAESGLKIDESLVCDLTEFPTSSQEGLEAVQRLLREGRKFTAVLAFDDLVATGAIRALSLAGLHVPADCSVIGFDDIAAAEHYNPPLTTIHQPMVEMGRQGASVVLAGIERVRGKKTVRPVQQQLEPQVIVRSSTAPPHPANRGAAKGKPGAKGRTESARSR